MKISKFYNGQTIINVKEKKKGYMRRELEKEIIFYFMFNNDLYI